jgi:hypothetical protein
MPNGKKGEQSSSREQMEPPGLCTGSVERPCSRLEDTPAQAWVLWDTLAAVAGGHWGRSQLLTGQKLRAPRLPVGAGGRS